MRALKDLASGRGGGGKQLPVEETQRLQKDVNEENYDPYDDWSIRDILLSLVPFAVTYAFRDVGLRGALAFALVWAWFMMLRRLICFDCRKKGVWPLLDIVGSIAFPILLGLTYVGPGAYAALFRWMPVILPTIFAFSILLSVIWRRPFTAHYARYPKFDRGGGGVWHGDASFRRTSDYASLGYFTAFSVMLLLSLIPILTNYFTGYDALSVVFNYLVPALLLIAALVLHELLGSRYRRIAGDRAAAERTPVVPPGASYPAGETAATAGETAAASGVSTGDAAYSSAV